MLKYKFIIITAALALAGCDGYQVALEAERDYCQRVFDGVHTNYDEIDCAKWGK